MSRNEDYLDNLLTSVTDKLSEFDDDFEQNRESLKQSYQTQNDLPSKTQSALDEVREDNFLREFEQDFQTGSAEDDFIREFERELDGDAEQLYHTPQTEQYTDRMEQTIGGTSETEAFQADPDLEEFFRDDSVLDDLFQDDVQTSALDDMRTTSLDDTPGFASDDIQTTALDRMSDFAEEDTQTTALEEPGMAASDDILNGMDFGDDLFSQMGAEEGHTVSEVPKGMEGLGDIFGDNQTADAATESIVRPAEATEQQPAEQTMQMDSALSAEIDSGLSEILNESDEEALAELSGMLNASPEPEEKTAPAQKKDDPFSDAPDFSYANAAVNQEEASGKKKKKEKNPNSIFARLSRVLFGTPEELNPEMAAEYAAAKAAAGGEMDPKELKAKKKEEKERKKQQKKEEAEQKKQEKDAAKAEKAAQKAAKAAAKPKKEKKPKAKDKMPKEPPLPKVPVIMMWTLSLSIMVLILLATSLLGYSAPVNESREAFENGDYVTAYAKLQGVKVRKADEELYHATSTLAGIQTQLDAYTALMEQKQYEMALDALVRGAGRCQLHSADAEEWGVSEQLEALETQFHQLLKEQFDVSKRSAKKLYNISKRSDYTLELHEILSKLGLY